MAGVETAADFGAAPVGSAERWKAEIRAFGKEREGWVKRVEGIVKRYRDERERADDARRFALLWANIEVLSPTLYARDPKPEVSRRFKDRDPVGRVAGMIVERNLSVSIDDGAGAFGRAMRACVKDFLLGGQGTAWVRYEVELGLETADDDAGLAETDTPEQEAAEAGASVPMGAGPGAAPPAMPGAPPQPVATNERAVVDYVHWRDFGFTAGARTWDEVSAVWRRSFLTRDALVKRFGEELGRRVPLDCKADDRGEDDKADTYAKAAIYEIWDASDRSVHWVHLSMDTELEAKPYPLKIRAKFPTPAPLFGTLTNGSLVPVPDYVQYQDQAQELDDLTGRIAALTSALRVAGFIPGDAGADVQNLLQLPGEGRLVPVKGWSMWGQQGAGGGKLTDTIVWLPIDVIVKVLAELLQIRERVKADAYEITGLSDILRGSTQASETATAQSLKAQWGSVRVRTRQQDVQRFAAELLNLLAEIMVGHFDVERLLSAANVQALPPTDLQFVPGVVQLLQSDEALLHYRIAVETDSTVEADENANKAAWTEMLQGVSAFLAAMAPIMQGVRQGAPAALPAVTAMVGELLMGAVRQLRAGPAVEASIEVAFEALGQSAAQPAAPPPAPPPDPLEVAKHQVAAGKVQVDGMKVQAERERTAADMAQAQDESAHRSADRHLEALQFAHQAATQAAQAQGNPGVVM